MDPARWGRLLLFLPAASALLGSLACGAKRSAADGTADASVETSVGDDAGEDDPGAIPPDDAGIDCPSNGWCWEHGDDSEIAGVPAPARLTSVWSSGPSDRWVAGTAGTVMRKVGTTWSRVDVLSDVALNGIWGTSPDDVWLAGASGTILHKEGPDWFKVIVATTQSLNAIWGSAADNFWIAGDGGTNLHRAGASWLTVNTGTTAALRGGWGSGADDVWAVGEGGTILHWNGTSGSRSASGTRLGLLAAGGTGPADAWAVGEQGMILHWNGTNWSPHASNIAPDPMRGLPTLQGVWARRPDDAWAVGKGGVILHWNGVRWLPDDSGTTRDLFAVRVEANDLVWAAAEREGILRRVGKPAGGLPSAGGGGPAFEPGPTNCSPTLILRFFSADPTPIGGVVTVIVKNERPGSSSTYTLRNGPSTIYADRGTGVSFCALSGTSGLQPFVVELRGFDGCLLATTSTMAYVLADITAIDLVFSSRGCLGDAGVDATP